MAKNKKPKFLEKETPDLLALLKETLSDDEADTKKALKIAEELISRQPTEEGPLSVDEALQAAAATMTEALNKIKAAYDNEVAMMEDSDGDEDSAEEAGTEEDGDEEDAPKKDKKGKKSKKQEEEEEEDDEDSDDEDSDDEDGEDYSEWPTKDLKKECRTRGIKVTKGMSKSDMVKALEADDKE